MFHQQTVEYLASVLREHGIESKPEHLDYDVRAVLHRYKREVETLRRFQADAALATGLPETAEAHIILADIEALRDCHDSLPKSADGFRVWIAQDGSSHYLRTPAGTVGPLRFNPDGGGWVVRDSKRREFPVSECTAYFSTMPE